jgi:ABC-type sulfate/molybdate transport systems ATPase subunit
VRPHDLQLAAAGDGLPARVRQVRRLAGRATLELQLDEQSRSIELDVSEREHIDLPAPGAHVAVRPTRYRVFAS